MDGEAWWATVHGVAKSWTRLSDFTFFHCPQGTQSSAEKTGMQTIMRQLEKQQTGRTQYQIEAYIRGKK